MRKDLDIRNAEGFILHGCNCQSKMGAGLAKAIAERWPNVKRQYEQHLSTFVERRKALGGIQVVGVDKGISVINCFTQEYYGRDVGVRYVSYDAMDECMKRVADLASTKPSSMDINIPKIGCSLAGGHWPVVLEIIKFRLSSVNNRVIMWMSDEGKKYELFEKQSKIEFK